MIADFDIGPVDELCEKYKVHRLYLFGSALTDKFNDRSDIDFYVEFWEFNHVLVSGLKHDLTLLFNRRIDLHIRLPKRASPKLIFCGYENIQKKLTTFAGDYTEMELSKDKALVTIALPVWRGREICWLSMESFCRQSVPFELIVFEEEHFKQLGRDWFFGWADRLTNCTKIGYLTSPKRFNLAEKWCAIADKSNSVAFCLCGCDDYYSEDMAKDAFEAVSNGVDYRYDSSAYFYHVKKKKMMLYSQPIYKGVMQAVPTGLMKQIRPEPLNSGVDRWIHDRIKPRNKQMITTTRDIVCTDGFNNISHRERFYTKPEPPFYATDKTIFDILPEEVAKKLAEMR